MTEPVPTPEADYWEVAQWFASLYREASGWLHIASSGNWSGRFFDVANGFIKPALYVNQLSRSTGIAGIYARVTTLARLPDVEHGRRGGASLTRSLPALWADIDLVGPGHRHAPCKGGRACGHARPHRREVLPLPPDEATAQTIVDDTGLPRPSLWIHSGGGLYPMWLINPVHRVTVDLEDIQHISNEWQRVIAASAERAGFHYGAGVGDLTRVLRIPGTWNRKTDQARPCRVIEDDGPRYGLRQLADGLSLALGMLPAPRPAPVDVRVTTSREGTARAGDDFAARVDWGHRLLLGGLGWRMIMRRGTYREWLRPEAGPSSTLSATTGRGDGDNLFVFSTETVFPTDVPISKLEAFRIINGYPTYREAVLALANLGFGSPLNPNGWAAC